MALGANQQDRYQLTPTVFIGCSSAALEHAEKIKEKLCAGGETDAKVWVDKLGDLGGNILDDLRRHVSSFDFAVLILSADDFTSTSRRGRKTPSPRDNVIFEIGLFMGARGRRRAFTVVFAKDISALKIPSDLAGNTVLLLDPDKLADKLESDAYLTQQIDRIRTSIRSQSASAALSLLPSAALASGYLYNFIIPVYSHLKTLKEVMVGAESYPIDRQNFKLIILLPRSLQDFGTGLRDKYVEDHKLLSYSFSRGERTYGFFFIHRSPAKR